MRTLTVSTIYRQPARFARGTGARVPSLRLTGRWLERHGFPPGARVHVVQNVQGELILKTV